MNLVCFMADNGPVFKIDDLEGLDEHAAREVLDVAGMDTETVIAGLTDIPIGAECRMRL